MDKNNVARFLLAHPKSKSKCCCLFLMISDISAERYGAIAIRYGCTIILANRRFALRH